MNDVTFRCPTWLSTGVMYQIFPDRFARGNDYDPPKMNKEYKLRDDWGGTPEHLPDADGVVQNNDFFGGNLAGIAERLPYLADLGVTVIYLNPIFEAYSNHRYDTADYMTIDPLLGSEEDFVNLCKSAKKVGIRILLDGVFNHTGSDSLYFNKKGRYPGLGAYQSKESPYFSWFRFLDYPDRYESWWGIDTLPSLYEDEPSYMDYILRNEDSVIRHWLRCGASGYRLDVVDELPDVFLDTLRIVVKSVDEDAAIIGEVWEDASTKISYGQKRRYLDGRQLDSVMNYPLRTGILDFLKSRSSGTEFATLIDQLKSNYPETVFYGLMNFLSTHDTPRILTVVSEGETQEEGTQILFLALLLWAFLPGIPCIYYGDEIGMAGGKDPFNRACFQPELADRAIQVFYKRILSFRRQTEETEGFVFQSYRSGNAGEGFFSFHREGSHCRLLAGVNAGDEPVLLPLDLKKGETIGDFIICGDVSFSDLSTYRIGRRSGIVVRIEK